MTKKQSNQPSKARPAKPATSEVQRTSVKRAQQASKRNTRAQAGRIASLAEEASPLEVAFSPGARRGFVWGVIGLALALLLVALFQNRASWLSALAPGLGAVPSVQQTAISGANPINTPQPATNTDDDWQNRVGIVSGHRGNDSGTVCEDGLTEAQVNFDAATRAASILRAQGYTVDVLDEFDARLKGYRALALLSIHADSCAYINDLATGYKVARFLYSAIPEKEDKLVACLTSHYKKTTGLPFHRNSVTHDMKQYHAFREIDSKTPGAIIELGFMYKDRNVLVRRKDDVAQGIANGLLCFLRGEVS